MRQKATRSSVVSSTRKQDLSRLQSALADRKEIRQVFSSRSSEQWVKLGETLELFDGTRFWCPLFDRAEKCTRK
jgi:hypothetical protein